MSSKKHVNEYYLLRQITCGLQIGCNVMLSTFGMGYTSPAIPDMLRDPNFTITLEQTSWVVSVLHVASAVGSIIGGPLIDRCGRKSVLLTTGGTLLLSWLWISLASGVNEVVLARFLAGVSAGVQGVAGMVYMNECVQQQIKPKIGIIPGLMGSAGFLIIYGIGETVTWRQLALTGVALCGLFLVITVYLPESPIYHLNKGNEKEAIKILTWYRETLEVAENEFKELKTVASNASSEGLDLLELTRPPYKWPVSTAILLMVFQQTAGITVIMSYAETIFEMAGSQEYSGICSIILALINIICAVLNGKLLIDYKRKDLLLFSTKLTVFALNLLGLFFLLRSTGSGVFFDITERLSFIPLIALVIHAIGFSIGWGPVPFVFLGEGLTSQVMGITTSLAFVANAGISFITTISFIWSVETLGSWAVFVLYSALLVFGQLVMNTMLPETKDKSMLQMDELYQEHAIKWYKNKVRKLT